MVVLCFADGFLLLCSYNDTESHIPTIFVVQLFSQDHLAGIVEQ